MRRIEQPLQGNCPCPACRKHSRAYLHHLFRTDEMLGPMLLTWHNVKFYQSFMADLRDAIRQSRLALHAAALRHAWGQNDRVE